MSFSLFIRTAVMADGCLVAVSSSRCCAFLRGLLLCFLTRYFEFVDRITGKQQSFTWKAEEGDRWLVCGSFRRIKGVHLRFPLQCRRQEANRENNDKLFLNSNWWTVSRKKVKITMIKCSYNNYYNVVSSNTFPALSNTNEAVKL